MSYFSSITMTLEITIFTIANTNYCLLWVFKPVFNSEILKNDLIFDQWILNGLNLVNVVVWFRSRSSYLLHLVILLIFCRLTHMLWTKRVLKGCSHVMSANFWEFLPSSPPLVSTCQLEEPPMCWRQIFLNPHRPHPHVKKDKKNIQFKRWGN